MNLIATYKQIKKSIVAFIPKQIPKKAPNQTPPSLFPIFGTGFCVREDGIILTNDHVVQMIDDLTAPSTDTAKPHGAQALFFHIGTKGLLSMPVDVVGTCRVASHNPPTLHYYGPPKPDLAFVHIKATGLPPLTIGNTILQEGMDVATAGFPMGTDLLTAPGWLHQIAPTLQKGIISAIMPFECDLPHCFSVDIMLQGGASGSPVFDPRTGAVLGLIYATAEDKRHLLEDVPYTVPTAFSYAVPWHLLNKALVALKPLPPLPSDTPSYVDMIKQASHGKDI